MWGLGQVRSSPRPMVSLVRGRDFQWAFRQMGSKTSSVQKTVEFGKISKSERSTPDLELWINGVAYYIS